MWEGWNTFLSLTTWHFGGCLKLFLDLLPSIKRNMLGVNPCLINYTLLSASFNVANQKVSFFTPLFLHFRWSLSAVLILPASIWIQRYIQPGCVCWCSREISIGAQHWILPCLFFLSHVFTEPFILPLLNWNKKVTWGGVGVSDDQLAIRLTVRLQRDRMSWGSNSDGRVCTYHYVYGCVCLVCQRGSGGGGKWF